MDKNAANDTLGKTEEDTMDKKTANDTLGKTEGSTMEKKTANDTRENIEVLDHAIPLSFVFVRTGDIRIVGHQDDGIPEDIVSCKLEPGCYVHYGKQARTGVEMHQVESGLVKVGSTICLANRLLCTSPYLQIQEVCEDGAREDIVRHASSDRKHVIETLLDEKGRSVGLRTMSSRTHEAPTFDIYSVHSFSSRPKTQQRQTVLLIDSTLLAGMASEDALHGILLKNLLLENEKCRSIHARPVSIDSTGKTVTVAVNMTVTRAS